MEKILELANQFYLWDPNEGSKKMLKDILESKDTHKELTILFSNRIAFGTAGLRANMGPGYTRMNDLVILQTCQGLAAYLSGVLGLETARDRGIVIGYDHRKSGSLSSLGFARISAAVFLSRGYKVFLLENYVPTPFVAFATIHLNCAAGIMVTASHNPKSDNGFKVYWGNGSQIIPPHDIGIASAILENLCPSQVYDTNAVLENEKTKDVTNIIAIAYYEKLKKLSLYSQQNLGSKLKVIYSAMHGVGSKWIIEAFKMFNLQEPILVKEQAEPDPNFTTVAFPNPEEKGALDLSMKYGDDLGVSLIIANDPDADRLAVAEKLPDKKWYVFTGNEIGIILGYWCISNYMNQSKCGAKAVLASIVSSRMLKAIANAEGIDYYDTLTGFKWLGNKSLELRDKAVDVIFSYEEALGYCVGDVVADKDGISAGAVFVEMSARLETQGKTVYEYLQSIYLKYGVFVSLNSYVICHDPEVIKAIFSRLRTGGPSGKYWEQACGVKIESIKDVTKGYDSILLEGQSSSIPSTPDSEMIMFEFSNKCTATLRTSGTEPKIKYYTELAGNPGETREVVSNKLHSFVSSLIEEMLQPKLNGLISP